MMRLSWVAALLLFPVTALHGQQESVNPGINDSYAEIDSAEQVGSWVERFEREGREIYEHRARIAAAVGLKPGMKVADVGVGTGLFLEPFAAAVGPRGRVYGVDLVPAFLDHVRQRARSRGLDQVTTVLGTPHSIQLPARSVDRVFLCDTYHHFEYPQAMLASIRSALRPGGQLVLIDFERIEGKSSDWILGHVRAGQDEVRGELAAAGFEVVRQESFLEDNYLLVLEVKPAAP